MLSYELREHVLDYINNRIDFEALEDWYVPRLREFLSDPNSADADVVAAIELAAAHLAEGLVSESEARDMLWDELSQNSSVMHRDLSEEIPTPGGKVAYSSTSSSGTITLHERYRSQEFSLVAHQLSYQ